MRKLKRSMGGSAILAAALAVAAGSAGGQTLPLRSPQVVFNYVPLQGFLDSIDPGIDVATDQIDGEAWSTSITGYNDPVLLLRTALGPGTAMGVYNAAGPEGSIPPLFQIFPAGVLAGWSAELHFGDGNLVVTLLDQHSVFQGRTVYPGVNPSNFGFYIQGPCGIWFSQDTRNAPQGPQMLLYISKGDPGEFWIAWETCAYEPNATFSQILIDFDDIPFVLTLPTTWGRVKSAYRK